MGETGKLMEMRHQSQEALLKPRSPSASKPTLFYKSNATFIRSAALSGFFMLIIKKIINNTNILTHMGINCNMKNEFENQAKEKDPCTPRAGKQRSQLANDLATHSKVELKLEEATA